MADLIFHNLVKKPKCHNKDKRKIFEVTEEAEEQEEKKEKVDDLRSNKENEMSAPQIKRGLQKKLSVDEKSLVIENKRLNKNREELENFKVVNGNFETDYRVYKRPKCLKD